MANEMVRIVGADEAMVNVTLANQNGDLPDPVYAQSSDADIKAMVTEAVRTGGIAGFEARADADFRDYVVDRFPPTEARPYNLIQIRPKTAFGMGGSGPCPRCGRVIDMGGSCPHCGR